MEVISIGLIKTAEVVWVLTIMWQGVYSEQ